MCRLAHYLVAGAALMAASMASGNIRAPRSLCRPGGSAPGSTGTDPNIVVHGEALNVRCGKTSCTVIVEYDVQVSAPSEQTYDFLAPFGDLLKVELNGRALVYTGTTLTATQWQKALNDLDGCHSVREDARDQLPIRQGRFAVAWQAGKHKLTMEYVQQLGFQESGHSYLSDGEVEKTFVYELWPLRTWTLAPEFEIKVMVQSDADAPSFFTALGGFERLSCAGLGEIEDGAFHRPDRVQLIGKFTRDFPDRLVCHIQDNGVEPDEEPAPL